MAATNALTTRELEVARLIATGLTNRQIGEALVIAEKTAANHVQRVLLRTGGASDDAASGPSTTSITSGEPSTVADPRTWST